MGSLPPTPHDDVTQNFHSQNPIFLHFRQSFKNGIIEKKKCFTTQNFFYTYIIFPKKWVIKLLFQNICSTCVRVYLNS